MDQHSAAILRTARANKQIEADLLAKLEDALTMRDLLWQDFISNIEDTDTDRLRSKMIAYENADNEVARLEAKAGLYTSHRKWFADYERLVDVGYKEA
jgi:hypothetical protein